MLRLLPFVMLTCLAIGCGPNAPPSDAGLDARPDAGRDAAPGDSGRCETECAAGRVCCVDLALVDQCVDIATDVTNCGVCGRDCVELRRGDSCVDYQCSCGAAEVGCTGSASSICCPPGAGSSESYCANLGRDRNNCGVCGLHCVPERASQCEGGMCTCGLSGAQCAGTPEDLCCTRDADDYSCVNTLTANDHCGFCGNRCNAFETCQAGECVSTLPPVDASVDAATSDAGVDASAPDADVDAGTSDAG